MNALQDYIIAHNLNETATMNALQSRGLISDNCVRAEDVADADCEKALKWLKE